MLARSVPTYSYQDIRYAAQTYMQNSAVAQLCSRLRNLYRVKHAFVFNSAHDALRVLLMAHNCPGGVAIPAYTCIVVPRAIYQAGYFPVFVDIDGTSLNVSAEAIEKSLSPRIKAVLITHLFGIPNNMEQILSMLEGKDLLVVEDASPAMGAEFNGRAIGTMGDAAIISFHSNMVISGEGGGALLTNSDRLALRVRTLIGHAVYRSDSLSTLLKAFSRKIISHPLLYRIAHRIYRILRNQNMYEVVPADRRRPSAFFRICSEASMRLILSQLDRLDSNLERRRFLAGIYREELSDLRGIEIVSPPQESRPSWVQMPVRVENKKAFYKHMQAYGVDLSWAYRYACTDTYGLENFPASQKAARCVLGLPTYPSLDEEQSRYICHAARLYRSP